MNSPRAGLFVFRLIPLPFVAAAIILIYVSVMLHLEVTASKTWPAVPGTVETSQLASHIQSGSTTWWPDIHYSYTVGEQHYQGDRVFIGLSATSDKSWNESVVEKFPSGAAVDVYYNPDAPQFSVLQPGISGTGTVLTIITVAVTLVAIITTYLLTWRDVANRGWRR